MITLAHATPDDVPAIVELSAEVDRFYGARPHGTPDERADRVRAALFADPPVARMLLAHDGHALAGLASYTFMWPSIRLSASLYLKELFVAEQYRRSGAGRLLMERLRTIASERGCTRMEWTTDTGNSQARAFYESLGAKPTSKVFYRVEDLR